MDLSPEALGLEVEEPTRAPAAQAMPKPEELGLETDISPEALGLETEPVERGSVGKAYDSYKQGAANTTSALGKTWDWIKDEAGQAKEEVAGLTKSIHGDVIIDKAGDAMNAAFHGLDYVFQKSNRVGGTLVASVISPVASVLGAESLDLMKKAQTREAQARADGNGSTFNDIFPVRLLEDVGMPAGKAPLEAAGASLQKLDSKTAKEVGEVLQEFAPGMSLATGLATSFYLDPFSVLKFGSLTRAGIEAEKAGNIANGFARQVATGERSLVELRLGNKTLGITNFGKMGEDTIAKAAEIKAKAELAEFTIAGKSFTPLQTVRKFTTYSPFQDVNVAREARLVEENGIHYAQDQFFKETYAKAQSLGVDLDDANFRKDLYAYADAPSAYKGKTEVTALEPVFNHLNETLSQEVQLSRSAGIEIPEKIFNKQGGLFSANTPGEMSERYVPRGVMPSKLQQLQVAKEFEDADRARDFIKGLEGSGSGRGSGSGGAGSYQKLRNAKSRNAMNEAIEQATGISDYFHDDIVLAYGEKITQLKRDRMDKKFVQSLVDKFGTSNEEFMVKVEAAKARVAESKAARIAPSADDLLMSNLGSGDLSRLKGMSESARNRLKSLSKISPDLAGAENLKVPTLLQDYVGEVLARPTLGAVASNLLGFQNALKGFMFFNPGFHIRNQVETLMRGLAVDVGVTENAKAFAGMVTNKGPWGSKRLELFLERTQAHGLATPIEEGIETALGKVKSQSKVNFTKEMLQQDHPVARMWGAIREMGSTGQWKSFLKDLREKGPGKIAQNPLFRFSAMVGAKGEAITKYAYFNKLIDEGYEADLAIRKVNAQFMNYENTRGAARRAQMVLPFANYMIKNAESTLGILAQNPRNAAMFAPSGAFARAIENWSGWDPERTWKMKDMMGVWANDAILLPVMPGQDDLEKEKDLIKRTMFKWFSMGSKDANGKTINELEGSMLWMRIPSNYHALQALNPTKAYEQWGPLVKAAWAYMGVDPFTGEPMKDAKYMETYDRVMAAFNQFTNIAIPERGVRAAQGAFQQALPEYEKYVSNLGLPDTTAKFLFGSTDPSDPRRKKTIKSLTWLKALATGGATQMDIDMGFRVQAKLKGMQDYTKSALSSKKALMDESVREQILRKYDRMNSELQQMLHVKSDYDDAVKRMKIAPSADIELVEGLEEEPSEPGANPAMEQMLKNPEQGKGMFDKAMSLLVPEAGAADLGVSRETNRDPAGKSLALPDKQQDPSLFDRASSLMKRNFDPRGQVVLPTGRPSESTENSRDWTDKLSGIQGSKLKEAFEKKPELADLFDESEQELIRDGNFKGLQEDISQAMQSIIDPSEYGDVEGGDSAYEERERQLYEKLPRKEQRAYYELRRKQHILEVTGKRATQAAWDNKYGKSGGMNE